MEAPPCVLAIDDSSVGLELLAAHLRSERLELVTCTNAERGLRLALELQPDLVLLDIHMPGPSGFDVCRRLKEDPRTASIPIIFLTGMSDVGTKVSCFDLGAVDFVTKEAHPAELRARVRVALRTKRGQDLLARRAHVDTLTGLANRAEFDSRIAWETTQAVTAQRPLSLVMIDLDHFKALNDGYGHPFGDLVLQRVADVLARSARNDDVPCRYGGEELALILPGTPLAGAVVVAERVATAIRALALAPRGQAVKVTASFGVAEALEVARLEGNVSVASLIGAADRALYAAKHGGRDRVCAAAPTRPVLVRAA